MCSLTQLQCDSLGFQSQQLKRPPPKNGASSRSLWIYKVEKGAKNLTSAARSSKAEVWVSCCVHNPQQLYWVSTTCRASLLLHQLAFWEAQTAPKLFHTCHFPSCPSLNSCRQPDQKLHVLNTLHCITTHSFLSSWY